MSSRPPVSPKENPANIAVMTSRWSQFKDHEGNQFLRKSYSFRTLEQRSRFVTGLMDYETSVGHCALVSVAGRSVDVSVTTPGIETVTELDKEYASFADTVWRDVVSLSDEDTDGHTRRRGHVDQRSVEEFDEFH